MKQGLRQLKKGTDSKVTERGFYNCFGTAHFDADPDLDLDPRIRFRDNGFDSGSEFFL